MAPPSATPTSLGIASNYRIPCLISASLLCCLFHLCNPAGIAPPTPFPSRSSIPPSLWRFLSTFQAESRIGRGRRTESVCLLPNPPKTQPPAASRAGHPLLRHSPPTPLAAGAWLLPRRRGTGRPTASHTQTDPPPLCFFVRFRHRRICPRFLSEGLLAGLLFFLLPPPPCSSHLPSCLALATTLARGGAPRCPRSLSIPRPFSIIRSLRHRRSSSLATPPLPTTARPPAAPAPCAGFLSLAMNELGVMARPAAVRLPACLPACACVRVCRELYCPCAISIFDASLAYTTLFFRLYCNTFESEPFDDGLGCCEWLIASLRRRCPRRERRAPRCRGRQQRAGARRECAPRACAVQQPGLNP